VFVLFPLGQEDSSVFRLPWVSIGLAAACVVMFFATWVLPHDSPNGLQEDLRAIVQEWGEHPDVELDEEPVSQLQNPRLVELIAELKTEPHAAESDDSLDAERASIEEHIRQFVVRRDHMPLRTLSLVPSRGLAQPGWLTGIFLHFGWLHLLGNLFFFYLVGPFLEDTWGRPLFAGFYLVGGIVASLAQFLLMPHADLMILGASGAIAACMGAFALRFASRRIKMGYFYWILRPRWGSFKMAAWMAGGLWFADQLFDLWRAGGGGGVAFGAHVAGFAFGAVIAVGLKASGIEAKYIAPKVDAAQASWIEHPQLVVGRETLARGDVAGAKSAFEAVIAERPDDLDALEQLARLELTAGTPQAAGAIDRLFSRAVKQQAPEPIRAVLDEHGAAVPIAGLRPALAFQAAMAIDVQSQANARLAEPLYAVAAKAGGSIGIKALVRAAELAILPEGDRGRAEGYLARIEQLPVPEELEARVTAVRTTLREREALASMTFGESAPTPPEVTLCKLLALSAQGLEVETQGRKMALGFDKVLGVSVAEVTTEEGAKLLTDLVLEWPALGGPAKVLRFSSAPTRSAGHARFLAQVLAGSGARGVPSADALAKGEFPSYDSVGAFEAAAYVES
jgi:membrane associated rhomboid family serine protease